MDAFAKVGDLEALLNRSFNGTGETTWVTALLESASAYLRDVIGQQIYPQTSSTFKAWPGTMGAVILPQHPTISVTSVKRDGVEIPFTWRDDRVETNQSDQVEITFTYGYEKAPAGLTRWACVLVSQTLLPLEQKLGLTAGGLSSVAIDDFKLAFADAGEQTGMALSDRNIDLIRRQYSQGSVWVGDSRP